MSKSKSSRSNSPRTPLPSPQLIARTAALDLETDDSRHFAKLCELIESALRQYQDKPLCRAVEIAEPGVDDYLDRTIFAQSCTSMRLDVAGIGPMLTQLFVVPILLEVPRDEAQPLQPDVEEEVSYTLLDLAPVLPDTQWLTDSFQEAGLSAQACGSFAHAAIPWLYSEDDLLLLSYTQLRRLVEKFERTSLELGGLANVLTGTGQTDWPAPSRFFAEDGAWQTRFILGACTYPADLPPPFARDEFADKLEAWRELATTELKRMLPGDHRVFGPMSLDDAFYEDDDEEDDETLLAEVVEEGLDEWNINPERVTVCISSHFWITFPEDEMAGETGDAEEDADEDEEHFQLRIAGYGDGDENRKVFCYVWDLGDSDDLEDAGEAILEVLTEAGIKHIRLFQELFGAELCECCGEPTFMLPPESDEHALANNVIPFPRRPH